MDDYCFWYPHLIIMSPLHFLFDLAHRLISVHKEQVLDLMVRMLGFSDEDKQRIGVAQQGAGKGVVRGVLGLPGRLVGGILRGDSGEAHANAASDNQVPSSCSIVKVSFLRY